MKQYLRYILAAGAMASLFAACRKTEDYKFTTELAINQRIVRWTMPSLVAGPQGARKGRIRRPHPLFKSSLSGP